MVTLIKNYTVQYRHVEARKLVLNTGQLTETEFDDELYSEDLY